MCLFVSNIIYASNLQPVQLNGGMIKPGKTLEIPLYNLVVFKSYALNCTIISPSYQTNLVSLFPTVTPMAGAPPLSFMLNGQSFSGNEDSPALTKYSNKFTATYVTGSGNDAYPLILYIMNDKKNTATVIVDNCLATPA